MTQNGRIHPRRWFFGGLTTLGENGEQKKISMGVWDARVTVWNHQMGNFRRVMCFG